MDFSIRLMLPWWVRRRRVTVMNWSSTAWEVWRWMLSSKQGAPWASNTWPSNHGNDPFVGVSWMISIRWHKNTSKLSIYDDEPLDLDLSSVFGLNPHLKRSISACPATVFCAWLLKLSNAQHPWWLLLENRIMSSCTDLFRVDFRYAGDGSKYPQ